MNTLTATPNAYEMPAVGPWRQRWRPGRLHPWRHCGDGGSDADRYEAMQLDEVTAKTWVINRHYSGTHPATRMRYGMWDTAAVPERLAGVAVLSIPGQPARAEPSVPGTGRL